MEELKFFKNLLCLFCVNIDKQDFPPEIIYKN